MTTVLIYSSLSALMIIVVSFIGVLFTGKVLGRWLENNLSYLVSFSAGVFLFISYNLINEALAESGNIKLVLGTVLGGMIIFWLIDKFVPEGHHHHAREEDCDNPHSQIGARKMLLGDGIHNIGDGIIIAPAFIVSIEVGIITTLGILIHEALQEISEFFVLRQAGYSSRQALIKNFLVSLTVLIGLGIGLILGEMEGLLAILLGLAAGAFIYIILADIVPSTLGQIKNKKTFIILISVYILGTLISAGVGMTAEALGLGHSHDTEDHSEEEISET